MLECPGPQCPVQPAFQLPEMGSEDFEVYLGETNRHSTELHIYGLILKSKGLHLMSCEVLLSLRCLQFFSNRVLKCQYYYSFAVLGVFQRRINDLNVIKCFRSFFHMKGNFSGCLYKFIIRLGNFFYAHIAMLSSATSSLTSGVKISFSLN